MTKTNDRALGAMYGLALGDALGATLEFMSRDEIRRRYPHGHREIVGGGPFDWAPGQVTDDTDMALCLKRGIEKAGLDANVPAIVDAVGAEFMKWRAKNPPDIGNTVRLALDLFARYEDWDRVAEAVRAQKGEYAAGNGALMRTLPISLFFIDDIDRVKALSHALTWMTHPHPEASWCSIAYNVFVCGLSSGQSPEVSWERVIAAAPMSNRELSRISPRFFDFPARARSLDESAIRGSGYCVDTLEAALWSFLTTDSAEECIVRAANLGDDTDTVAAVAGGLAGAHYGLSALPERWIRRLDADVRREFDAWLG